MKVVKYFDRSRLPHFATNTPECDEKIVSNKIYTSTIRDATTGEMIRWWYNTAEYLHILVPNISEVEFSFKKSPFGESFKYIRCECIENISYCWGWEFLRHKYFYARTREEALEKFYSMKTTDDWKGLRENWRDLDEWSDEFDEKCKAFDRLQRCVEEYKSIAAELAQSPAPSMSELIRDGKAHEEYIEKIEKLKTYEKVLDVLGVKHENYQCRL